MSDYKILVLFVISVILVTFTNGQKGIGESCTLRSGERGECTTFNNCDIESLIDEGSDPVTCSEVNKEVIVCCPKAGIIDSTPPRIPTTSKATQKCEAYKKIKCTQNTIESQHTIVNGEPVVSVEEFPHMALIGYGDVNNPTWECGGALISEQYILTAAHCLLNRQRLPPVKVNMGFLRKNNRNEFNTLQEFNVIDTFRHPDRKGQYNDIALLKLDRPAFLNRAVLPACLHETDNIPTTRAQATGWGDTFAGSLVGSNELLKVTLKILPHDECRKRYNHTNRNFAFGILKEQQFCAWEVDKDTCQGDSGGPLQIIGDDYCMHNIIGITSFGDQCATNAGVYARVSNYVPWIESIAWS